MKTQGYIILCLTLYSLPYGSFAQNNKDKYAFDGLSIGLFDRMNGEWAFIADIKNNLIPENLVTNALHQSNFIVVRIKGPASSYKEELTVSIKAFNGKTMFAEQDYKNISFSNNGYYFAPILINESFCEPVELIYELYDKKQVLDKESIKVNFACSGE